MSRHLAEEIDQPVWPVGARPASFHRARAEEIHALLRLAYLDGGGSVAAFPLWWAALSTDEEFDGALCFLAEDRAGRLIGVAQCWTSAFVKDLAVHPDWRRRGVGRALLLTVFREFRRRGAVAVDLKVQVDNPAGAIRLYRSVGMSEAR